MANVDVSFLSSVFQEEAPQMFADALSRGGEFYNMFRQSPVSDPRGPRWWVKTSGTTVSRIAEGGLYPTASRTAQSQASLSWGEYIVTVSLTKRAEDQLRNGSQTIALDVMGQLEDGIEGIRDQVNTDLLAGTNSNGVTGVTQMVLDDNTYAGLDRTSVTNFAAYTNDNSGSPRNLTSALMDTTHNALVNTRRGTYDRILTSPTIFDVYTTLSSGNGIPTARSLDIQSQGGAAALAFTAGFQTAWYRGRPVIAIPGYSNRMDFVDMSAPDGFAIEVSRDINIEEQPPANGTRFWAITFSLQAKLVNPRKRAAALTDLQ